MTNEYLKKIKKWLVDNLGTDPELVLESSHLQDDLNLDDLEVIELLEVMEEQYHVELIARKDEIETIQDLIDILIEEIE